jgi:hypothetical protein
MEVTWEGFKKGAQADVQATNAPKNKRWAMLGGLSYAIPDAQTKGAQGIPLVLAGRFGPNDVQCP